MAGKVTICAGGDVLVNRENPESILEHVVPYLREADIAFCQNEGVYSERGVPRHPRVNTIVHPRNAVALKSAGIDVISCASNHTLDGGPDALADTLKVFKQQGASPVGAGMNIEEARRPVILERSGTKIAFLAYSSILPTGIATADGAGPAPMRVYTFYQQVEFEQPGTPARALTFPYLEDLEAMKQDIEKVRPLADIVVVSQHWGVHFTYAEIAMYERLVGHTAIDAGADIILGHHPHVPKGVDVYKGKVIFHSLAHLGMDVRFPPREQWSAGFRVLADLFKWYPDQEPEWAAYPFLPDSRKSLLAKIIISDKKIQRVSFLPMLINKQAQAVVQRRGDAGFDDVVKYMTEITQGQGLKAKFTVEGDEVVVSA